MLAILAGVGAAHAADLAVKAPRAVISPASNWSGFYAGVNAGAGFGSTPENEFGMVGAAPGVLGSPAPFGLRHRMGSGFAGAQAGVNWQNSNWVWGLEADIQGSSLSGSQRINGAGVALLGGFFPDPANFVTASQKIDTFGTLRARAGILATPDLLLYGTAGLMGANLQTSGNFFLNPTNTNFIASKTGFQAGWVAGAGLEYKLGAGWSVKGEYLYYDLGNRSVVSGFGTPVALGLGGAGLQSQYNFATRGSLARLGLNYAWGNPDIVSAYAADMPVKAVKAAPISMWQVETGARYFYSSGKSRYTLMDPFVVTQMNSQLTYRGLDGHAGEAFARADHSTGFFAKGFLGGGTIGRGALQDEDFPPAAVPYSSTNSLIRNGSQYYGTIDAGWAFWTTPGAKVGAFVGYNRFYENMNGYGCQQTATNVGICGVPIAGSVLVLSKTEAWDSLRVGLNGVFNVGSQWKVTLDGAYLPYVSLGGFDNHWLRPDINPLPQAGRGWGYQLEGIIAYDVTRNLSLGVGGRYWYAKTDSGTTQFPGVPASPTIFSYERYGGFVQASYKFGEPLLVAKY